MIKKILFFILLAQVLHANTLVHRAIKNNNAELVLQAIANGTNINRVHHQHTPLLYAITLKRVKIVELLLKAGAKGTFGTTNILFETLMLEDLTIANQLFRYHFPLDAKVKEGQSLLYALLLKRKYKSVEWLLHQGVKFRTTGPLTPFALAVSFAPLSVIQAFLDSDTRINASDTYLGDVTSLAIALNRDKVAKVLLGHFKSYSSKMLHQAVREGNTVLLQSLLEHIVVKEDKNSLYYDALMSNNLKVFDRLFNAGIAIKTGDTQSVLLEAMQQKRWETVEWIFAHQDDMSQEVGTLFLAIQNGDINSIIQLINKGLVLETAHYQGTTPLLWAFKYKRFDIVHSLLDHNASFEQVDKAKETALYKAVSYHKNGLVQKLLDKNASFTKVNKQGFTPLYQAVRVSNFSAFEQLVQKYKDANISMIDETLQKDPLALSVKRGLKRFFYTLFEPRYLTLRDEDANTLLHIAAYNNQVDIARHLVLNQSDMETLNARGETPLIVASKEGGLETVSLLVLLGANTQARDTRGYSAINWARKNNHKGIVKWLESFAAKQKAKEQKRLEEEQKQLEEQQATDKALSSYI